MVPAITPLNLRGDRDRLRQDILESLGWKIRRIWSTDWFKNPEAQLQPILNELNELKTPVPVEQPQESIMQIVPPYEIETEPDNVAECRTGQGEVEGVSLKDHLVELDANIRLSYPDTPENQRLLRSAMTEALLHHLPTSKEEFTRDIPRYLRDGTDVEEAKEFLGKSS